VPHLFCFGLGYCARTLARRLTARGWTISGTCRGPEAAEATRDEGFSVHLFDGSAPMADKEALEGVTHVLSSVPPDADGDPVLRHHGRELAARANEIAWAGYLSTTGVYGDHGGARVDEETEPRPVTARAQRRLAAEGAWHALHERAGLPVHIFRLAGIYGPGRNPLRAVAAGRARRIVKPGQLFGRIHVDDVAAVLEASMARPRPGAIYNVADDEPAPPQDVIAFAAELLGREAPPEIPFGQAEMSPMARSFYGECKRVANARIKEELGVRLAYPSYREGLRALAEAGEGRGQPEGS